MAVRQILESQNQELLKARTTESKFAESLTLGEILVSRRLLV